MVEAFAIIFIHWFADFVLQTHYQATNKSKSWRALLGHVGTYSLVWLFAGLCLSGHYGIENVIAFTVVTFICHTITDYFTSRLNAKLWAKGDVHNFFVSVGFDQVLHYGQLFLTFYLLTS